MAPEAVVEADPASTWPVPATDTSNESAKALDVQWVAPDLAQQVAEIDETIYLAPTTNEIVASTAGFNASDDSVSNVSANKINIALYHIETLRQLIPDLTQWSVERAGAVNSAIAAMELALKGREADDQPFNGLRHTVAAARKDPRDIDVMIALSDRALDIEDLLKAHDNYSIALRTALIDLKPLAVEYVKIPAKRRAPARKPAASRSRSTAAKSTSSTAKSSTAASKSAATASKSTASTSTRPRKTSTAKSS
ncbi:MAG: hypothetical protein QM758_27745 [Armatimonas sp.]